MFSGHIHSWRVSTPGDGISNAEFPVVCNPNMQRMEVTISEGAIRINTFDVSGKNTNTYTLELNR